MAAARSLSLLLLAGVLLAASFEPAAAASIGVDGPSWAFLGLRLAGQSPPAERPEPQERSESRLAFVLSRVREYVLSRAREGVWRGQRQPLALAQWATSRSHWAQPAAITEAADDLGEQVSEAADDLGEPVDWKTAVAVTLVDVVLTVIIIGLMALLYTKFKPPCEVQACLEDKAALDGDFKHGLFSCFETPRLACLVCFCPGIRWSDTTRMAGFLAFPTAVLVVACIYVAGVLFGASLAELILALVGIFYRRKLRQHFSMDESLSSMVPDCLKWCCCMCCTIVQEARQLEEAQLLGHDAVRSALPLQLSWRKSDHQTEPPLTHR